MTDAEKIVVLERALEDISRRATDFPWGNVEPFGCQVRLADCSVLAADALKKVRSA